MCLNELWDRTHRDNGNFMAIEIGRQELKCETFAGTAKYLGRLRQLAFCRSPGVYAARHSGSGRISSTGKNVQDDFSGGA